MGDAVIINTGGNESIVNNNRYTIYPNGMLSAALTLDQQTGKYILNYTKHYYAGSQRINSKLGKGKDVGQFNCGWLIIPFGAGSAAINEKAVAKEKLEANTAASLAIMAANGITPPPNYGQNAGYNENCVSSYTGVEEKDTYWYHPDHLGSSSFITGLDGEVTQNIEYFPSGEVFVENHKNSYNTPYKFNGKEQDDETGYYYYGARYYNPRVSLWLNVDPLADYNPFMNDQAYIDGEHNVGVYNSGNNNPYIYCYQSPINYTDPNGKQTGAWEIPAVVYLVGAVVAVVAAYNVSEAAKKADFSRYETPPVYRETIPAKSPKITREEIFRDKKESLRAEIYPAAKKDKLTIRTFPKEEQQGIIILNASKRKDNKLEPDKGAFGDHSTFETDDNGDIYKYETYEKTKTGHFNPKKRFDGGQKDGTDGADHNGITTPHINFKDKKTPVRKPTSEEYPRNNRFKGK
ncbi:polymorphic toxin type 24 domain-containing protein [Chryseobacterium sp. WG14]|uniref:RHS repeat-associated core domain-containing protein n=1 Tax=Chryseobacterium sp. WG14 TaxID=2926909 RepID=UPI00211F456D|nr:RHS repeat-associated core domain-containing protein [Chryseobacterium sp. WG14]MCQ9640884.1 polymorphic toxin type 24 domain-containing protein [Chryseobacterium sp. WG14]